ncbi:MotA/TolQ/ExbB proton channel family protein [Polaribacter vadi]|uniref:MotA/TolQ/ExbB proton channel family protein n=1 Tax=Polaribacter TaxID=52959 RepID=UPI001C08B071|nr:MULTISPECIES: MotA/TolQ/ExbB proton channel family protein [Polaribacter]MBU3012680.1 MotA/TolQ/ExbB proton channel family protein [Polaribacter vadi]MDO6742497.1 MotA/TolQ/ExbB proton channel family protein [Polaribacter sp. 1_MG-2023]
MASILAIILLIFFILGFQFSPNKSISKRIFLALGGDFLNGGYIQFFTYIFFFYGVTEILRFQKRITIESSLLQQNLLPEEQHKVINSDDVSKLKHKSINFELQKEDKFYLTSLINQAATKYRANQSIPEVLETLIRNSQLNIQSSDSSQSMLRYVAWVIPSVGFIGTVLGISGGIGAASGDMSTEVVDKVTSLLGVAFDTTLISLILSIILMYLIHRLQEKNENLHTEIEQYVMNNFINRIYVSK